MIGVAAAFAGCHRPAKTLTGSPAPSAAPINACGLLTSTEIAAVQGESIRDAVPSNQPGAGMATSQCYFATPTANKSVVLTLWQRINNTTRSPREFWDERFHGTGSKSGGEDEEQGERLRQSLVPVPNLGDEAFWSGTNVGGALYVRKGDRFFRVAVGGADEKDAKIKRSKALAEAILKRL